MTLDERIAKRKAEGWRLLCWVVKRDDRELGEQWLMDEEVKHGHWGMDSVFAKRFGPQNHIGAGVIASSHKGARAVPVFARTIGEQGGPITFSGRFPKPDYWDEEKEVIRVRAR